VNAAAVDTILASALAVRAGGVSIIPIDHTTKRPDWRLLPTDPATGKPTWAPFMERIATEEEVRGWIAAGARAFAAVCGAVSGGLYAIDFDEARFYDQWQATVGELADSLVLQKSGRRGGGYHVLFRMANAGANDKFAWFEDGDEEIGRRIAIESRGEGGYIVLAPSEHPDGFYELLAGDLTAIPTITREHADVLLQAARDLDEMPLTRQQIGRAKESTKHRASANGDGSVIDAYNERFAVDAILEKHGYQPTRDGRYKRPGGASGSVYVRDGRSFHHSSNDPLSDGYWHRAFDLFCQFEHNGDCKAAVRSAAQVMSMKTAPHAKNHTAAPTDDPRETGADDQGEPDIISAGELIDRHPKLRDPVIGGIARKGDVVNTIGATKTQKSFNAHALLLCAVAGKPWLDTFTTPGCPCLLIDNELHASDIAHRLNIIAKDLGIYREQYAGRLDVWSLRGRITDIGQICERLMKLSPGRYGVIVLDALYRALPIGTDENDNAQATAIYNLLARVAEHLGAVIVIVHHTSKGSQGSKSVTDVGAGAGAYSRSADAHMISREHQEPGCVVMEVANRSFAPVAPIGLRWVYPLWHVDESLDVTAIRTDRKPGGRPPKSMKEQIEDASAKDEPWTPTRFAKAFVTADPQTSDEIVWEARNAGLSQRDATSLLRAAIGAKLAIAWPKAGNNVPTYYANRPPTVAEMPSTAPKPNGRKGKGANE
jgi:hypothetical protein